MRGRLAGLALVLLACLAAAPGALAHGTSGFKAGTGTFAGEQRVLVILATWWPEPFTPERVRQVYFEETDAFIRAASFGKTRVVGDVTPWLAAYPERPAQCETRSLGAAARDAAMRAGFDVTRYSR